MNLPNKIEAIKPNYHRDDAIMILEEWFDEWSIDYDWWHGAKTWDINIYRDVDGWYICIYPLVRYDDSEVLSTDTTSTIDKFYLPII